MPQITGRGRSYLTKEANTDQFRQNYGKRLDELAAQKADAERQLEDLEIEVKRLDGEEQLANLMEADQQKMKRLIPIYRSKRAAKDNIKETKAILADIVAKMEKVQQMDRSMLAKENIFTAINIDVDKVRLRKTAQVKENRYYDKQIDLNKLKHVKRGLYLDILESAGSNKVTFKKNEKKYDVDHILEKEKQYKQENEMRMETAALRQKSRLDRLEKRNLQLKMMRNNGDYTVDRVPLYPGELTEADYSDHVRQRLASAGRTADRSKFGLTQEILTEKTMNPEIMRRDSRILGKNTVSMTRR